VATEREIFARNLRRIVNASHRNSAQIAAELGISRGTFSDYLHCRAYPRPQKMAELCQILGVSQYDLTTDEYAEEGAVCLNREVTALAQNIYENPDARALYTAILKLEEKDIIALKTIVMSLSEKQ